LNSSVAFCFAQQSQPGANLYGITSCDNKTSVCHEGRGEPVLLRELSVYFLDRGLQSILLTIGAVLIILLIIQRKVSGKVSLKASKGRLIMPLERIIFLANLSKSTQSYFKNAYGFADQHHTKLFVPHILEKNISAIKEDLLGANSTDEKLQNAVKQLTEQRFLKCMRLSTVL
jgi:hypothetical protein